MLPNKATWFEVDKSLRQAQVGKLIKIEEILLQNHKDVIELKEGNNKDLTLYLVLMTIQ